MIKAGDEDSRRTTYGHGGYEDRIATIPCQEFDFKTASSRWNDNSSSYDWGQIPFITYSLKWIQFYIKINK